MVDNGVLADEIDRYEFTTPSVFKDVNEWKNRLSNKTASNKDDATYSYDANGNLTAEVVDIVRTSTNTERRHFTYDAFNRLISVHLGAAKTTLISEYRYNGLGQRTRWRYDANGDKSVGSTERYHYMYDDRWRVVGVFRDADSTPKESFVYHAAGNAGRGSSSYIDSVIVRDRDVDGGGGEVEEFQTRPRLRRGFRRFLRPCRGGAT